MTVIAFRPVATVTARDKARGEAIVAVQFTPTPSSAERLARQRILFRPFPGGFRLAAEHDLAAGGAVVPLAGDLPLLFAMRLGPALAQGEAMRKAGPIVFLSNRGATGTPQGGPQLSREDAVGLKDRGWIVPRRHRASFPLGAGQRPNRVELRSWFGGAVGEPLPIEAAAEAESADVLVSLEDAGGVAFLLRPKPQGAERLVIADDELAAMPADGALELVLRSFPGPAPAGGREFAATFET